MEYLYWQIGITCFALFYAVCAITFGIKRKTEERNARSK